MRKKFWKVMVARVMRFLLDLDALLGLDRLMEPFGIAAAFHQATGELVDDDDLAVADDVVAVALEEHMGTQGVVEVGDHLEVLRAVEILMTQPVFDVSDPFFGQRQHALFPLTT